MARLQNSRLKTSQHFSEKEDVNPMNYIGNMSDVMLVLAVGIMLALVMAWKLDINTVVSDQANTNPTSQTTQVEVGELEELNNDAETLQSTTDEDSLTTDDYGLTEYGIIYQDENGDFYIIEGGE